MNYILKMILKPREHMWMITEYVILLTFFKKMSEAVPITGVGGQSASFNFTITSNPNDTTVIFVKHPSTGDNLLAIHASGAVFVGDDRVTNARTTRSRVAFTLNDLIIDDAGVYKATINTVEIGSQELKIIGKPKKPTITDIGIPVLGEDLIIRCSATSTSSAGILNLVMSFQWYKNDGAVSTEGRYTVNNNDLTISSIVRADVSDSFQCEAWEDEAAKSEKSNQHSIPEPAYGPDNVIFTPSTTIYTPVEDTSISVITCTAQCGPDCSYSWRKDGQTSLVSGTAELSFSQIKRNQSGQYQCTVTNNGRSTSASSIKINISVYYGPNNVIFTPSTTTYTPVENTSISVITCTAQCGPDCSYSWRKDWQTSLVSGTAELSFGQIKRYQSGQYQCTVTNNGRSTSSSSVKINISVYYPPDAPPIIQNYVDGSTYTVIEGVSQTLTCTISGGVPPATLSWSCPGVSDTRSSSFGDTVSRSITWSATRREDGDQCTCKSQHTTASWFRSTSIIVHVEYMATVSELVMLNATNNETNEGDKLSLRCRVDGNPAPTITIKFAKNDTVLSELPAGLVHTYTKQNVECLDQGTYGCVAHNFINGASDPVAQIEVTVRCTPRYDHRRTIETAYYSSRDQNVTFYLYLISSPPPTEIRWFMHNNNNDNKTEVTDGVVKDSLSSALSLFISTEDMFGNYTAIATYDNQEFPFNYFLVPREPPSQPVNFTVVSVTFHSVTLSWRPGFNGGLEQTFKLFYRKSIENVWKHIVVPENKTLEASGDPYIATLSSFDTETEYEFKLLASNTKGNSDGVEPISITTEGQKSKAPTQTKESNAGLIVGCLGGGIVIGALTVAVTLVIKRRGAPFNRAPSNTVQLYDNLVSGQMGTTTYSELQTNGHAAEHSISKPSAYESIQLEQTATGTAVYDDLNPSTSKENTDKAIYENTFIG